MKGTVLKIVVSLALLLVLLKGLELFYDFALRQNYNIKASFIQKEHIDAQLLVHGPCEPLWMISPAQLSKATDLSTYNLALSHSDFADNYLHLYLYLKNNKPPSQMLLYVTPESMDENYNTFNTYRFAPYAGDAVVDSVLAECDPGYSRWRFIPFMKYAYYNGKVNFEVVQGLKHYLSGRKQPYFPDGYEPPFQVVWDNHLEEFAKLYPQGYYFKWSSTREKYLVKTILLAQRHGIKLYLYESPVLNESLAWQPNREEIIGRIDALATKYGIKYARFQDMKIADSRQYYMSALNTNLSGSAIFTDSLASFIRKEIKP